MATGEAEGRLIVRTESVLGGDPRIDGTRIGVHHVVFPLLEGEHTIDQMVTEIHPDLTEGDVLSTLHYYAEHREEVNAVRRSNDRVPEGAITGPDDLPAEFQPE